MDSNFPAFFSFSSPSTAVIFNKILNRNEQTFLWLVQTIKFVNSASKREQILWKWNDRPAHKSHHRSYNWYPFCVCNVYTCLSWFTLLLCCVVLTNNYYCFHSKWKMKNDNILHTDDRILTILILCGLKICSVNGFESEQNFPRILIISLQICSNRNLYFEDSIAKCMRNAK